MKCNRKEFLDILKVVMVGTTDRPAMLQVLSQGESVFFMDSQVFSFNDQVSIRHKLPDSLSELTGAVQVKLLVQLLGKLSSEEIELEVSNDKLTIKTEDVKATLALDTVKTSLDEIKLPEDWLELPDNFMAAIKFASFSISRSISVPILRCVHVKGGLVTSSDTHRITLVKLSKKLPAGLLIPGAIIGDLDLFNPLSYATSDGWLHFQNEFEAVFSMRVLVDFEYPDVLPLFEIADGVEIEFPSELIEGLQQADLFLPVDEDNPMVQIELKKNQLVLKATSLSGAFKRRYSFKNKVDMAFQGAPKFLCDMLALKPTVLISGNKMLVTGKLEGQSFKHLVALSGVEASE